LNNQSTWIQTVVTLKKQVGDFQAGQILKIEDTPTCTFAAEEKQLFFM
jgi:hypothetical protein